MKLIWMKDSCLLLYFALSLTEMDQMSLVGLHHVQIGVPDSAASVAFLQDFGLLPADQAGDTQYLRSSGTNSYSVVLEPSDEARLIAVAFEVENAADLERAVEQHGGTAPQPMTGPGGGTFVDLTDPEGKTIRLVHGVAKRAPDELSRPNVEFNYGNDKTRKGAPQHRLPTGPAQLLRMGHVGLFVRDMTACDKWYQDVLGLLESDRFYGGKPDNYIAGFYRLNRGDEWVDHHTIALFGYGRNDLHHVSFEVQDFEAQFVSHRWLHQRQYESIWGVGRHPKGCHVFDLWREPAGYRFETFSDTDLYTADHKAGLFPIEETEMDLWRDRSHEPYFE